MPFRNQNLALYRMLLCVTIVYYTTAPPHTPCLQEDSGAAPRGIACIQISAAKCMNIHTVWGKRTINSLYPSHQFKSGFATRSTRKMTLVLNHLPCFVYIKKALVLTTFQSDSFPPTLKMYQEARLTKI